MLKSQIINKHIMFFLKKENSEIKQIKEWAIWLLCAVPWAIITHFFSPHRVIDQKDGSTHVQLVRTVRFEGTLTGTWGTQKQLCPCEVYQHG